MIRIAECIGGLVIISLVAALYLAKSATASEEQELAQLQAELARERGRISSLEAEIAHQEDPENLRQLARIYLGFEPVRQDQEFLVSQLPNMTVDVGDKTNASDLVKRASYQP